MSSNAEHLFEWFIVWLNGLNRANLPDGPVNLAYFPNLYEVCTLNPHLFFSPQAYL